MKILLTGPNKCGKSVFAEDMLLQSDTLLGYFATLAPTPENSIRIKEHIKRRDDRWRVVEVTEDVKSDFNDLEKLFKERRHVLLDGLTNYLIRVVFSNDYVDCNKKRYLLNKMQKLLSIPYYHWIVVDIAWEQLRDQGQNLLMHITREFHSCLITQCNAIPISMQYSKGRCI